MNEIQKYIAAHEPKMMDDLFSLIRIPSRCGRSIGNALTGQSGCFRSKDREPGCKDCINLRSLRCDAGRTIGTLEKRTV